MEISEDWKYDLSLDLKKRFEIEIHDEQDSDSGNEGTNSPKRIQIFKIGLEFGERPKKKYASRLKVSIYRINITPYSYLLLQ